MWPVVVSIIVLVGVAFYLGAFLRGRRSPEVAADLEASHTLEKILAAAQRLNATRHVPELSAAIVRSVREIFECGHAVLYLWSPEAGAFTPREIAGDTTDLLALDHVSREAWMDLAHPERAAGPGYLCPCGGLTGGSGGEMAIPLATRSGEQLGILALSDASRCHTPDGAGPERLEFFVRQAATALESADVYDTLARRNEELSVASRKLQGLAELKKNLVANVGHELRTPLTSIAGYTEMLQRNIDSMDQGALEDFLDVIASESEKLSAVINDILEVAQMERPRAEDPDPDTDVAALVEGLAHGWRERARDEGVDLVVSTPRSGVMLPVDRVLTGQMLTHLVGNAFKFTPEGGRIRVALRETGTAVRLRVEDSGAGIPPDQLGEIFEEFHQVDGSATRTHNGQGLGLAICRDVVRHHEGRIWAENLSGGGSRFTVLLPRRSPVVQSAQGERPVDAPFAAGEFTDRLLHWVAGSLGVKAATLMVPDEDDENLVIRAALGLPPSVVQSTRVPRGEGFTGKVWKTGRSLLVEDVTRPGDTRREENEPRYTTSSLLCVPLTDGRRTVGVVTVNNRTDGRSLDEDDLVLLETLAPRLAVLIGRYEGLLDETDNFRLLRDTLRTTTPVGHVRRETLQGVCREICLAAGRRLGLAGEDIGRLAFALSFYDVGLEEVPRGVLRQSGPLTESQLRMVRSHVHASLRLLAPLDPDPGVNRLVLHHHENFDGTGYPEGLAGEAIPVGARLIRLADTLESMLTERPGRQAMTLDAALDEIREETGRLFCPRLTGFFLAEVHERRERLLGLQTVRESVAGLIRQTHAVRTMV